MSGIAGYVGLRPGTGEPVLERMARQLVHRGPHGQVIDIHGGLGLVHRHLAVIDRDGGSPPARSADGRWILLYDGEVYNFRELREELTTLGHSFVTDGDTEVVLASWQQWGSAAFERFNGMFALAVADTGSGEVVLARDPLGIKPLYLAADGFGRVAFASEIRAVLAAAVVPRRTDDVSIYRYLRHGVLDDTERTFFAGISRLLPGQAARITPDGGVHRDVYARLRRDLEWLSGAPRSYDRQAREEIHTELVAAVRRRLVGDVPVGTALSDRLPESAVVATVDHLLAERDAEAAPVGPVQQTFTAVLPGEHPEEQHHVDEVARICGRRLAVHAARPDAEDLLADLADFIRTQEEPVGSAAVYAQYLLIRRASEHVSVVLGGAGGEEVFAGYPAHRRVHLRQLLRRRRYPAALTTAFRSGELSWPAVRRRMAGRLRRRRIVPELVLDAGFATAFADERVEVADADLKQRLAQDVFEVSLPALLRYGDRNSMRFSVEGRAPLLDPALLRLLWGLDDAALISGRWNRRALRDVTAGMLPRGVRWRRSEPEVATDADWLTRMRNLVYEVLTSESFGTRRYFDQHEATRAFRTYLSGRTAGDPGLFWRLVNVELWLREFIDVDPTVPLAVAGITDGKVRHRVHHRPHHRVATTSPQAPPTHPQAPPKPDWKPNPDKDLATQDGRWTRYPLRVDLIRRGDNVAALAASRAAWFFTNLADAPPEAVSSVLGNRWYLFCSEKVVAISQGRSFATWEIEPSWWARRLSRFVVRSPHGIGLSDPTTMQLAIQEVGLPRVLAASAVSAAGKAVGRRGLFYRITGPEVDAIDGPTPFSAYPANVSAKLAPSDPDGVARHASATVRQVVAPEVRRRFGGTVVIDTNDLGCTVLGHDTKRSPEELVAAFADNPLGQGREQTPFAVVVAAGAPQLQSI
jgi:asparagine synthase (glutamine-hydrolysing)